MLQFPLIRRELQVQSRKRGTFLSRLIYGLMALAFLATFAIGSPQFMRNGAAILSVIHGAIALLLGVTAPIAAADAISKEKREGTLGLLMLTPITPSQVALGKFSAHLLRICYFLLTMLPFLVIPVLIGGVSAADFGMSAVVLFTIGLAGASAGLWASAICTSFTAALFTALVIAAIAMWLIPTIVCNAIVQLAPSIFFGGEIPAFVRYFILGPVILAFPVQARQVNFGAGIPQWLFPTIAGGLIVVALLFFLLAWAICARRVARHSAAAVETKRQAALRKRFLKPVLWKSAFRRTMSRNLDRNPLIWLEYRTAWARSARWAMLLIILITETWLLTELPSKNEFIDFQISMLVGVLGFMTFKSCGSFQREKESGAFELLLVTPLTEGKLVAGRLRAVATYFGPAVVTLAAVWILGLTRVQDWGYHRPWNMEDWMMFASICAAFVSAPVLGLFFALRCKTFLPALICTGALAYVAPVFLWGLFAGIATMLRSEGWAIGHLLVNAIDNGPWMLWIAAIVLWHVGAVFLANRATLRLLRRRDFVRA